MTDANPPAKGSPLQYAMDQQSRLTLPLVRNAVEKGNGVLAFQPVVQAERTNRPAFYEGLIRIIDESGRMVPLRDFMPVAETTESSTGEPPWAMTWKTMVSAQVPCASTTASMAAASRG